MRIALAGAPGAGKSALFELLGRKGEGPDTGRSGLSIAHVDVPDPRLAELSRAYRPRKTTPARLQFEDLEEKGGPAYPNLSPARREMLAQADLILLVVDLFSHEPSDWSAATALQWHQASDEFVILDLATVEGRLEKLQKLLRIGHAPAFPGEPQTLEKLRLHLEAGRPALTAELNEEERRGLKGYSFLSQRPLLPAFNVSEGHLPEITTRLEDLLRSDGAPIPAGVFFSAEVEQQILQLPQEEQETFLQAFGLREPAVSQVIRAAYRLAGLHCFFTVGEDEVRAWSILKGTRAAAASGVIHTDLSRGFVRAEVLAYDEWSHHGSHAGAREKGAVRAEGREYEVRDGDIIEFRSGLAKSKG
jgi:ribosome-binding ATPase